MRMEEPIVREQSNVCKGDDHGRVSRVARPAYGNEVCYPCFLACADLPSSLDCVAQHEPRVPTDAGFGPCWLRENHAALDLGPVAPSRAPADRLGVPG